MKHSAPFKFKGTSGSSDDGKKRYSAIASTDTLDRDREVLLPKGVMTENFLKNPVMLEIHNYRHVPIGKVLSINVEDAEVTFDFEFIDSEEGKELEDLYIKGYMNAFSVGLYPLDSTWIDEDTPEKFEVEVADGSKIMFDLTKYKMRPRRLVNKWELLEISPVPVPSNPDALLLRAKENIVRKFMDSHEGKTAAGQLLQAQVDERFAALNSSLKDLLNVEIDEPAKAVPSHSTKVDAEIEWDDAKARSMLAMKASEDGSGDKEKMNWGDYAKGFAWVDSTKADQFSSYKLAHHTVVKDELVGIWKGITIALAQVLGGKNLGGMLDDDKKDVYKHLSTHYADMDKAAPPFDKDYTEDELKAIADGRWEEFVADAEKNNTDQSDDSSDDSANEDISGVKEMVTEVLTGLKTELDAKLDEMDETIRLRMNIVVNMLEELHDDVKALKIEKPEDANSGPSSSGSDDDDKEIGELTSRFTDLAGLIQSNLDSLAEIE